MTRTANGRAVVFGRLVEAHLDRIYSSAYRFTRNKAEAEDLVQETLTRAWAHLDPERSEREVLAWVYRILVNIVLDRRRRDGVLQLRPTDPAELPEVELSPSSDVAALRRLTNAEVRTAIDSLPEHYRLPVMLVDIDGFSYEEVAAQLGAPIGTVTSRLQRGRVALRRMLWQAAASDGIQSDVVCREAGSLIAAYCRGETSSAQSAFVEAHLERCLHCRDVEEAEREVLRLVREKSCRLRAPVRLVELAWRLVRDPTADVSMSERAG
ncbi:MAG: sigma-70 family RNA polymerase sigma factor [Actinomycetota bacterium]